MNPPPTHWVVAAVATALYGLVAIAGGTMGYVNKGSKPSLIAGTVSGILLLASAVAIWLHQILGPSAALVIALLLAFRFLGTMGKESRQPGGVASSMLGRIAFVMVLGGAVVVILSIYALAQQS
jgi:uncharacterized membrane protein (UPF0136 family)